MRYIPENRKSSGFSLVELLVISPLLILVVAVLIDFMISITGDALRSRERNTLVYSVQEALNQIDSDVRLSTDVVYSTGTLTSPLGSNNSFAGTSAFTSSSNVLVLELRATDKSPLDPTREFRYYANSPNPCSGVVGAEYNESVLYKVVYFLDGTNLTKRTLVDFGGRSVCSVGVDPNTQRIYQHNSCKAQTNLSVCYTKDTILAQNITDIEFLYYTTRSSTSAVTPAPDMDFRSVRATITGQKDVAGSSIEQTSTIRSGRMN